MGVNHRLPSNNAPGSLCLDLTPKTLARIADIARAADDLEGHGERVHVIDIDWPDLGYGTEAVNNGVLTRESLRLKAHAITDETRAKHSSSKSVPRRALPYGESVLVAAGYRPEYTDLRWEKGKSGLRVTAKTLGIYAWDRRSDVRVLSERLFLHDLFKSLERYLSTVRQEQPSDRTMR